MQLFGVYSFLFHNFSPSLQYYVAMQHTCRRLPIFSNFVLNFRYVNIFKLWNVICYFGSSVNDLLYIVQTQQITGFYLINFHDLRIQTLFRLTIYFFYSALMTYETGNRNDFFIQSFFHMNSFNSVPLTRNLSENNYSYTHKQYIYKVRDSNKRKLEHSDRIVLMV